MLAPPDILQLQGRIRVLLVRPDAARHPPQRGHEYRGSHDGRVAPEHGGGFVLRVPRLPLALALDPVGCGFEQLGSEGFLEFALLLGFHAGDGHLLGVFFGLFLAIVVAVLAKQRIEEARGAEAPLVEERVAGVEEGLPTMKSQERLAPEENVRWYRHLRSHDGRAQWERSIEVFVTWEVLDLHIIFVFSTSFSPPRRNG